MRTRHTIKAIDKAHAVSICRDIAMLTTARIIEWGWSSESGQGYVILEDIEPETSPEDIPSPDEE